MCVCVCVCVCVRVCMYVYVCVRAPGKNNIVEGGPYGSKVPVVVLSASKAYSLAYSWAVWRLLGRSWEPRLS